MTATAAPISDTPSQGAGRARWFALAFLSMGVTMVMIDATIVNVAVPQLSADLNLQPTDIEWINSIYALVFASLLITMGKAGDVLGRRRIFMTGAVLFVAASLIAATAQSGEVIIAGRALQGIGGAMLVPSSLSLLNTIFRGKDRAIAFAVWGAVIGTVATLGPLLGGWLTTSYSWRWAFLINVPVAIISVVGTYLVVSESRDENAKRGADVAGVLLSIVGLGLLVFGLIEGQNYGWWTLRGEEANIGPFTWPLDNLSPVPFAFALSAAAIAAFLFVETKRAAAGRVVVLDLTLFKVRSFRWGNLAGLVIMFGEFGLILTMPLFLQNVLGFTALRTGFTISAIMVGALLSAPASGKLAQRYGPLLVVQLGLFAEIVAMIGLAFSYQPDASQTDFVLWLILFGVGVGFGNAQLINLVLRDVPMSKSGQASGTQSTSRQVGTALGVAVLGAALWISLGNTLDGELSKAGIADPAERTAISESVVQSTGTVINNPAVAPEQQLSAQFGTEAEAAAAQAYSDAMRRATLVGAAFVSISFFSTFGMRRRMDEDEEAAAAPIKQSADAV